MKVFGTDGVRGKAGEFITPNFALELGIAAGLYFGQFAKTKKILIGKDTRRSGYMIENALVSAFTSIGYDVIQIGPMPTPAIAFLTENMRCDAGVMISASHNPYYDNGIKFFDRFGNKLKPCHEVEIEKILNDKTKLASSYVVGKEIGSSKRIDDVVGRYIVHIKNSFPKNITLQDLRIVVDTANGAAYKVAPTVLSELGADVVVINDEPNGFNINENCGAISPNALAQKVLEYRADIGFALDGDADRLVVVDNKGNIIDGDVLLYVLATWLKSNNMLKNDGFVMTNMSNLALEEKAKEAKITVQRCDIGDKYVLESMQKSDFNFGGENSGHIIFSDYTKTGDGLLSALQVLAVLKTSDKTSFELFNSLKLYPSILENIKVDKKTPLTEINGLKELLGEIEGQKLRHLIRYSGTEDKLRILLEGENLIEIKRYLEKLKALFKAEN